jgi:hypothetical protein
MSKAVEKQEKLLCQHLLEHGQQSPWQNQE